jgi:curved DNA-binding protein CbpA
MHDPNRHFKLPPGVDRQAKIPLWDHSPMWYVGTDTRSPEETPGRQGESVKGRVVLRAVESILDANSIDDLVGGQPAEAGLLYALLNECALGEAGRCFDAICQVAEKRGVTPAYLIDRADVLLGAAEARRAGDLYRILGVPALASAEEIRARWREVVKECHPDVAAGASRSISAGASRSISAGASRTLAGIDARERFETVQRAYEVLGDARRREEYEERWRQTLESIEEARTIADALELDVPQANRGGAARSLRTLAARVGDLLRAPEPASGTAQGVIASDSGGAAAIRPQPPTPSPPAADDQAGLAAGAPESDPEIAAAESGQNGKESTEPMQDILRRTDAMFEAVRGIEQRLAGAGFDGVGAVAQLFEQLHAALEGVSVGEIDSTLVDIDSARQALDGISRDLVRLRRLKVSLGDGAGSNH